MALPLVYAIMNSFKPIEELFLYPPRFYVMRPVTSNYTTLFRLINNLWVPFSRYTFNSIFVCTVTTIGQILIASAAAYSLSKFKTRISWFFPLVVISLLFNGTVLGIPQYIVLNTLGIVNTYWVYILPSLASSLGLFLMKQFMEQVPMALIEAAKIDGANHFTIFLRIVMPSVKPAWLTLLLYAFQAIWAMTSGSTIYNEELKLLPNAISQVLSGTIERTGASAAGSVLLMIPPILVFILTQSSVIQTMTSSGIKE
ncbi:MAG: carbohydrate ABC transporter permease [Bacteroidaceae bacterium]|nr:carbohydrate ABC transporter permease [Bacteroidaceae bacterium]